MKYQYAWGGRNHSKAAKMKEWLDNSDLQDALREAAETLAHDARGYGKKGQDWFWNGNQKNRLIITSDMQINTSIFEEVPYETL